MCCEVASSWGGLKTFLPASQDLLSLHHHNHVFIQISYPQQAGLLLVNSILILNRRRFLSKYGLDDMNHVHHHGMVSAGDAVPLRTQIVGLLHAVQYLKVPIIACNIVTIVFEMLLGGT